jgi:superoxide dismutase
LIEYSQDFYRSIVAAQTLCQLCTKIRLLQKPARSKGVNTAFPRPYFVRASAFRRKRLLGRRALSVLLELWFGSYENWEAEFKRTANALSGGSGWTILAYNLHTKELHNYWASDHAHNAPFSVPLLVLNMYEHSYQMDYGAAAKYVDAFMQNVNWEEVNRRVENIGK